MREEGLYSRRILPSGEALHVERMVAEDRKN